MLVLTPLYDYHSVLELKRVMNTEEIMSLGKNIPKNQGIRLAEELRRELAGILGEQIQVILFGSHARDEATNASDVDMLVVLPDLEKDTLNILLEIAWQVGFEAGKVISVVPATQQEMQLLSASPFFQAVQKEGIPT